MASDKSSTPALTRSRKGSLKETSIKFEEFTSLQRESEERLVGIQRESEERIKQFFRDEIAALTNKIQFLEANLKSVQVECAHLGDENRKMKDIMLNQQYQIESHEARLRANNLIIHNLPEDFSPDSSGPLNNDNAKIEFVVKTAGLDIDPHEFEVLSTKRLGKRSGQKIRPLKITLRDSDVKYKFLNKRRDIANNDELFKTFHQRIFVSCDSSFLVRKEEFRLRQRLKDLKTENPNTPSFIRSGSLYLGNVLIDRIDVKKQLF